MSSDKSSGSAKLIFAPAGSTKSTTDQPAQAEQYNKGSLDRSDLDPSPFTQFHQWFTHAQSHGVYQPETVTLSTATLPSGAVSARMVFLKELDARGFVIYSNWETSRKSEDVRSNPQAALTFWWHELERQVRVEGRVELLKPDESQVYYDTRVRGSRIGAWASPQSQVLADREELAERVAAVEKNFEGQDKIPVPDFWGGMRVIPSKIEFWQGRDSRLHDRFRYTRSGSDTDTWQIDRLSP